MTSTNLMQRVFAGIYLPCGDVCVPAAWEAFEC
jgi:hypothetical protein